jgi:hypothetical protein
MITWNTTAGNLGVITERVIQEIPLSATSTVGAVTYSIIAGNLPRGLRLSGNHILGSPVEVKRYTESRFVVRASDGVDLEDRTFSLSVDGSDVPYWLTNEGFLKVGEGDAYFILDNSFVSFQLDASDTDLTAGDELTFYLTPNAGELPPGLSISKTGLISGFTDPVFALEYTGFPSGGYDTGPLDVTPLDFVESRSNGFDTFFYDNVTYDYNEPSQIPRRLSRIYNFVVSVTDGVNVVNRLFKIFVVTEEFLQSDNSIVQVDTNLFQADSGSGRKPLWITESGLGRFRANNYVTIFLDVYDPPTLNGTITYFLLSTNPDGSASALPPGMTLDSVTGEIAGKVPYQAAVTKTYSFTMMAVNFPATLSYATYTLKGDWNSFTIYAVNDAVRYQGFVYTCTQTNRNRTPEDGSDFWFKGVSTADKTFTVDIIGEIESAIEWVTPSNRGTIKPNQPSQIYIEAKSLLYGGSISYEWVSGRLPPGLRFLPTGDIEGKVKQFADDNIATASKGTWNDATSYLIDDTILYNGFYYRCIRSNTNKLPFDTEYWDGPGLTRFFDQDSSLIDSTGSRTFNTTFDGGTTSFDKTFKFVIKARDTANVAESLRSFSITVIADGSKTFANMFVKAFQSKDKRLNWYNFITDSTIFNPNDIYRYGDENFGIQTDLKMLMFAGIESVEAVTYVQAMSRNHYRKRLLFGDLKVAKAKDLLTQETIYEVIYVDVIDDLEKNGKSISSTVQLADYINSKVIVSYDAIKVDSDIPFVSDADHQRIFPNSIKNMRRRIKNVGERDREFLPLWMRSIQDTSNYELGFTRALVLCYTKPERSADIVAKIKGKTTFASRGSWSNVINYTVNDSIEYNGQYFTCIQNNKNITPDKDTNYWVKNFNFKDIDFTADRYLIDIIDGQIEDKYLAFPQRGEKLP